MSVFHYHYHYHYSVKLMPCNIVLMMMKNKTKNEIVGSFQVERNEKMMILLALLLKLAMNTLLWMIMAMTMAWSVR